MINLLDLGKHGMMELVASEGEPPYRADQIFQWTYQKAVGSMDEMTNVSKTFRKKLMDKVRINYPEVLEKNVSSDGTEKLALRLTDGIVIECVMIPEDNHWTICVSSQAGCAMGCRFCHTATMGFLRDLEVSEIVSQVLIPLRDFPERKVRNVVFMGMGEPLLNYDNVVKAINILTDPLGPGISRRRITVSTCGIIPGIARLWDDTHVGLALSLNAATDDKRNLIMPVNTRYPLAELKHALMNYPLPRRSRITLEYVLLRDINDSIDDARQLVGLSSGLRVKVNLIPFNPWPGAPYRAPEENSVEAFRNYLSSRRIATMLRTKRGDDIMAACGQLAGGWMNGKTRAC
ncbi:MAG TPA: 23S rRNA (adenine(2503)-C(2))-methyltransferase RlmN [Deltaproteobacteria bacterium]|nr:23S rRNA (adenine(2503)-C(2))-methyltransferase RlmN [Deltaproteobacteria bacterium]